VGYDSNIFLLADDPISDWYWNVTIDLPFRYKLSRRSTLSLGYRAEGEWYSEQTTQLDDQPSRQNAGLSYAYGAERGFTFGLRGNYNESQRPEDVFTESGVDFGRSRARTASAGTSVGHSLGPRGRLSLDYNYSRALYREDENNELHIASAVLGRQFSRRTRLDLRYAYSRYLFSEADVSDEVTRNSQVATLGIGQSFGRGTTLSAIGGIRFTDGNTTPEASVSLSKSWRGGSVSIFYAHTQAFVPSSNANGALSEVDSAGAGVSLVGRRHRVSLSPSYYRNRIGDFNTETFRGVFDFVYKLSRWLGLGGNYQYTYQESSDLLRDKAKRQVARFNIVISPWADRAGFAPPR
jgi:hypothetical protein